MLKDFKYHITIPVILLLFGLSMALSYNIAKAWTNPASSPPIESLTPIAVVNGGTAASSTSQARLNLGVAASGANSDITSLSPSGNLILSPTGGVGIGTTSLGTGALVTVNGNLVANGELQSTLQTGDGQIRMIAGNYGAMWRNDGTNTWFLLTASGSQYGGWNSLRPMQISDSSGEVYMANGLDVTSGGITFPDGTVQTTAAGGSVANGSSTWTTPGTYTWTVPTGVTRITAALYGGGGGGGWATGASNYAPGGGGGGGGYTAAWMDTTPGNSITVVVGAGGGAATTGGNSSVSNGTITVVAYGGSSGGNGAGGGTCDPPGSISSDFLYCASLYNGTCNPPGSTSYSTSYCGSGGAGGSYFTGSNALASHPGGSGAVGYVYSGGPGGGGAGSGQDGGVGTSWYIGGSSYYYPLSGGVGGAAAGMGVAGGKGGNGTQSTAPAAPGSSPSGGGAGGGYDGGQETPGTGGNGEVIIFW